MAETPSTMLELGIQAPAFELPNTNKIVGKDLVQLDDFTGQPLLVAFICNHCPYVVHIIDKFSSLAAAWGHNGVNVVAISSNDAEHYPADSPAKMTTFAQQHRFQFPYLYDEDQQIAKSYQAACTPDFFLFNQAHELVYRGQFDGARPGNSTPVSGSDLDHAVSALITGKPIPKQQIASVGCSIKWKSGNAPDYF